MTRMPATLPLIVMSYSVLYYWVRSRLLANLWRLVSKKVTVYSSITNFAYPCAP